MAMTTGRGGPAGGWRERDVLVVGGRRREGTRRQGEPGEDGDTRGTRQSTLEGHARTLAIAASVFAIGLDNGGYSITTRTALAAIVWTLALAILVLRRRREAAPRAVIAAGGALLVYALIAGVSIAWSDSAERSFLEFDRALMYLGVFAVVAVSARSGDARTWLAGLGIGAAAVCILALVGRCFPSLGLSISLAKYLPSIGGRLSYPLGYWNGLGILAALAMSLMVGVAATARTALGRGAALAAVPALAATIYLTSSRGAVAVVAVAVVALVLLAARRVVLFTALASAAAGSAVTIAVVVGRGALADRPGSAAAASQGHSAAVLIAVACLLTGLVYAFLAGWIGELRLTSRVAYAATASLCVVAVAGAIAADPPARVREFKAQPPPIVEAPSGFVQKHLLSGNGSGRWQFWSAAVSEFRSRPVAGRGAGSYEAWWTRHQPFYYPARNAHSLWLQTLGELGILGFAALASAFAIALGAGFARMRALRGESRAVIGALTATFIAWIVGAALDWIWELTAVGLIGVACLAVLTGRASAPRVGVIPREPLRAPVIAVAFVVVAAVLVAQGLPWLTEREIGASQAAVRAGDARTALARAADARDIEPWAASPRVQLGLVEEASGNLTAARASMRAAIRHDPTDWRVWLTYTRIEVRSGQPRGALRGLARVRRLNPRLPLLAAPR